MKGRARKISSENCKSRLLAEYEEVWSDFLKSHDLTTYINERTINRQKFHDLIGKYLLKLRKGVVLELGCGTGIDLNIVASRNKDHLFLGTDLSTQSISLSKQIGKLFQCEIKTFVSDAFLLPLGDHSIDLVFSQGLVEHFKDPIWMIREQLRILKGGGFLLINVPQKYAGYTLMKRKLMRKGKWPLGWETEFSYKDLQKIGQKLGLTEREVIGYQYWRSWKEPIFVLRDVYNKFHRRNPFMKQQPFPGLKKAYDSLWEFLENKWGHFFLQNIVIVFQKQAI